MEKEEILNDDFLKGMLQKSTSESPSEGFADAVMHRISIETGLVPVKRTFIFYVKSLGGYILLALFIAVIIFTSDIPWISFSPFQKLFTDTLLPYFYTLFLPLKSILGNSKSLVIPFMIVVSAGIFFFADKFLSRRFSS